MYYISFLPKYHINLSYAEPSQLKELFLIQLKIMELLICRLLFKQFTQSFSH